jgi:ABC-type phosphate/phosphonate transport system substrate-binding protein
LKFAILPMYDFDELRPATDALWAAIAARLDHAPAALTRTGCLNAVWADPGLLLGQTCGYPLVTSLRGHVALVATPRYRAAGCAGALYSSAVIVRADDRAACLADLRGRRCALNDLTSNSGMNVLRAAIAPLAGRGARFFREVLMTGGHVASVAAVAEGQADVASIDCVTWAHLCHLRPRAVAGLRVLAWTEATAGLPLVTSVRSDSGTRRALRRALGDVARDPALAQVRDALRLEGFERLLWRDYAPVLRLERRARQAGYPVLQ